MKKIITLLTITLIIAGIGLIGANDEAEPQKAKIAIYSDTV